MGCNRPNTTKRSVNSSSSTSKSEGATVSLTPKVTAKDTRGSRTKHTKICEHAQLRSERRHQGREDDVDERGQDRNRVDHDRKVVRDADNVTSVPRQREGASAGHCGPTCPCDSTGELLDEPTPFDNDHDEGYDHYDA